MIQELRKAKAFTDLTKEMNKNSIDKKKKSSNNNKESFSLSGDDEIVNWKIDETSKRVKIQKSINSKHSLPFFNLKSEFNMMQNRQKECS